MFKREYIKILSFFLGTALSLFLFHAVQEMHYFQKDLVPDWKSYLPDSIRNRVYPENITSPDAEKKELKSENYFLQGPKNSFLKRFYTKLENLEKEKAGTIKIIHYGDSIIWSDILTYKMKTYFQKDFGDGGRGLVPVYSEQPERYLKDIKNFTYAGQFETDYLLAWTESNKKLGFLGETAVPVSGYAALHYSIADSVSLPKKLDIHYKHARNPVNTEFSISLNSNSGLSPLEKKIKLDASDPCGIVSFNLPETRDIKLNISNLQYPYPSFDAVNMETAMGVAYSSVSRKNMKIEDFLAIDESVFSCELKNYNPDLIVFQFGVNESQNLYEMKSFTLEKYREKLIKVIALFQRHLPGTDLLLISPGERIRRNESNVYISMPEILQLRSVHKEITAEKGIALYDLYTALGEEGSNKILFEKGVIQEDRVHYTRPGGDYLADLIYTDIYNSYLEFKGENRRREEAKINEIKKAKNKEILFNSRAYAYFLFLAFIIGILTRNKGFIKVYILLCFSIYFYSTSDYYPLILLTITILTDFICSSFIFRAQKNGESGAGFLFLSLFINFSILFAFKYLDFFISIVNSIITDTQIPLFNLLLPVGISFYTFQSVSFTIDVYRKKITPECGILKFIFYVTFFPQLVAGPIIRAVDFLPGIETESSHFTVSSKRFSTGIFYIIAGLLKKSLADYLATNLIDRVYTSPEMYSGAETLAAVYAYALQIYWDFSGYSDIAIGSAKILGYDLTVNFNSPYIATSITEFWRRWHITLGTWFREYLYIPLGGNKSFVYRNLFITMFFCGLWHGAGIFFVLWGVYHGLLLMLERLFFKKDNFAGEHEGNEFGSFSILRKLITLHLILFGWILFRSDSYEKFTSIIDSIANFTTGTANLDTTLLLVILIAYAYSLFQWKLKEKFLNLWNLQPFLFQGFAFSLLIILLYNLATLEVRPFIYFRF